MLLAYMSARKSYWQGRSSVLLADYMEAENGSKGPQASGNKNKSCNNSEFKPKGIDHDDDCGVGPRSDSRVSNQKSKPPYKIEETEPETMHNLRTNSRSVIEIEEVSQKTDYQDTSNCNPNADVRTNGKVPTSSGAYDPSSMRGYRYLIQGETWQEVETKKLEDKLQLRITHEEKLITLDKIWQCKDNLLGEWGDKDGQLKDVCLSFALYRLLRCRFDDYPLPKASIPKTRTLLVDGILSRTKNGENAKNGNKGPEEFQDRIREENEGTEEQKGATKEGNRNPEKQGSDNDQCGVEELNRDEKQPNTDTNCQNGRIREPDKETKKLEESSEEKKWSAKEQDGIVEAQQKDEKQPDACAPSQNGSREKLDRDTNLPDGGAQEEQGNVKEQDSVIENQKDGSNSEKNEDEVKEVDAEQVFEITGTELSFLSDYMYSRFPVIFWSERGIFHSILLYINLVASMCCVGISISSEYSPDDDFFHEVHGYNIDLYITWGILLFVVFKETWEILIYLFSDWTKVMLISMYVECPCMRNWLMENMIWLICKCSMVGRWHGKIDQYNFLEAYDYKPSVCNLAHYLSLGLVPKATDGVENKSQIVLPKEVKKAIVKSISSLLREEPNKGRLPGGMPFILSRNNVSAATFQICELQELHSCSHIILVWHIATSLCEIELCRHYNIYLAESELPSLWSSLNFCSSEPFLVKLERLGKGLSKNFIVANSLSRYCAHLLIKQPDLLPDHIFIAEDIFQHAVHEARNILEGCDTLQTIYKRLMKEGGKDIKSKNEKTIMRLSARLGKILIENLDEEARWKALAGVWADLLVYMAPNSNVEAHEECLATGGELITHVWILLYHAGILENSLVDQGEDKDIENPDGILENSPIDQEEENDVVYQNDAVEISPVDQRRAKAGTSIQDGASSPKDRQCSEGIDFNKMGPDFKCLHDQTSNERGPKFELFTVRIPPDLFHHKEGKEGNVMIYINDIAEFSKDEWLNVTIIQTYMLHMYKYCMNAGITSVGFMDPSKVNESFFKSHNRESKAYMSHAMEVQREKKLILAPYFQRQHWVLLVIMPIANTVYVLDSNHPPKPEYTIEKPFNDAFLENICKGGPARGSNNVSFKQLKCPRQPTSWECGYYVMNFMRDIIMKFDDLDHFLDVEAGSLIILTDSDTMAEDSFLGSNPGLGLEGEDS